jgi:shikimate kinase
LENVILIGMPGAGKSTVGVLLAKTLGYGFLDTDLLLQQREGALLQTILDTRGPEVFLDVEETVIAGLECSHTVIAPGGSAVCRDGAMARLKALGPVIYLRLTYDSIEERLANIKTRGVVMAPGQTLRMLYDARTALCVRYADIVVDADGHTPEETVAEVLDALNQFNFNKKG